ncbi:MAG: hypothetical protein ACT4OK_10930 [Gemmobacter sp.]
MRIILEEHEIEAAIDAYVRTQIAVQEGQHITTRLAYDPGTTKIDAQIYLDQTGSVKAKAAALYRGPDVGQTAPTTTVKRPRGVKAIEPEIVRPGIIGGTAQSDEMAAAEPRGITATPEDRQPEAVPAVPKTSIFAGLKSVPNDGATNSDVAAGGGALVPEDDMANGEPAEAPVELPAAEAPPKPKSIFSFGAKPVSAAGA